jgi:dTDP-4-dehydrorhamnose reductase
MVRTMLVLGASGLTGYKLMQLGKKRFETYGTYNIRVVHSRTDNTHNNTNKEDITNTSTNNDTNTNNNRSLLKLDIKKEDEVRKLFREIKPDIVINTIALHNVDYCESHEEEAFSVNTKAVGRVVDLCNNLGCRLVHISTDFVFDGNKGTSYSESDSPNPISVYAKSKLEGEQHVRSSATSYSILRPSVVYGWTPLETQDSISSSGKPINFALWALSKMNKGERIKIVNDQFTSPTLADILAAVALRVAITEKNELYHVSGTSCISRYEFTKKISIMMGYSSNSIEPVQSNSFSQAAKRPINSCLDCQRVQTELKYKLPDVDQSLAIMRSQIEIESPHLLGN